MVRPDRKADHRPICRWLRVERGGHQALRGDDAAAQGQYRPHSSRDLPAVSQVARAGRSREESPQGGGVAFTVASRTRCSGWSSRWAGVDTATVYNWDYPRSGATYGTQQYLLTAMPDATPQVLRWHAGALRAVTPLCQ